MRNRNPRNSVSYGSDDYCAEPFGFGGIFSYPVTAQDHVIYIDDVGPSDEHHQRLQTIREAGPNDTIRIIVNTDGGEVATAMAYVNAINESDARISTHAEGRICSAGTILWLAGKERTISPLTIFMFHNYQGGFGGDGAHILAYSQFNAGYFKRLFDVYYGGVLTEEEIAKISNGGQVWMDEVELLSRTHGTLLTPEAIAGLKGKTPEPQGDMNMTAGGAGSFRVKLTNGKTVVIPLDDVTHERFVGFEKSELGSILYQLLCMEEGVQERDPIPNADADVMISNILSALERLNVPVKRGGK